MNPTCAQCKAAYAPNALLQFHPGSLLLFFLPSLNICSDSNVMDYEDCLVLVWKPLL